EQILLSLSNTAEDENERPWLADARNRILVSLRSELLVTQEANDLQLALKSDGEHRELGPLFSGGTFTSSTFTWREYLEEQGVDLSEEPTAVAALESVEKFQAT